MRKLLTALLLLLPALIMTAFNIMTWRHLPATVPIHWDLNGQPNGWASRNTVWLLPFISLFPMLLLKAMTWRPGSFDPDPNEYSVNWTIFAIGGLAVVFHTTTVLQAVENKPWLNMSLATRAFGVFMIVISVALERCKRNPWIGVRTPWTLASDVVWDQTHRFTARILGFGGLGLVLLGGYFHPASPLIVLIGGLLAGTIYSYRLSKAG